MWARRLLLSFTLLGLINGATSKIIAEPLPPAARYIDLVPSEPKIETKCDYFMAVPIVLRNGQTGQVCILVDCEEVINLDVVMEHQFSKIPIFNDQISSFPFFDCRSFPVPFVNTLPLLVYLEVSLIGKTVEKRDRKGVAIDKMPEACFVQMEKPKYKPRDIIRSKIFCLNHDLKPTKQNFTVGLFMDPTGACIQKVPLQTEYYVASMEVTLSEDAIAGGYNLMYERENADPVTRYVQVENYDLSRFQTTVTCPNKLSVLEKYAPIAISAQYIYKKPLPATFIGKCCRNVAYTWGTKKNCYAGLEDICVEFTGTLDETGAYTKHLILNTFKLQLAEYDNSIQCTLTIKENGTGILDTQYCYMSITAQPISLQLDYSFMDDYYRNGLDYQFAATLTNDKGEPMANEEVTVEVNGRAVQIIRTDAQGRAECAIDTSGYHQPNITVQVIYRNDDQCYIPNESRWSPLGYSVSDPGYPSDQKLVRRFFSETDSFLYVRKMKGDLSCFKTHKIAVDYKLTEAAVGKGATTATICYTIKSREEIVSYGQQKVDLTKGFKGSFSFDMLVTPKYAKNTQILVFAAAITEIISASLSVTVESCFENQVFLTFTESVVAPGSEVTRELTAEPGSLCGLRAHDASLDTFGSYDSFNPDSVYYALQYYINYQVREYNLINPDPPCEDPDKEVYCNGRHYKPTSSPMDGDTDVYLTEMNLVVTTSYRVKKAQVCGMEYIEPVYGGPVYALKANTLSFQGGARFASADIVTFRNNFEETFGYVAILTGPDGKAFVTSLIPDAITKWRSDMFCLSSEKGVGLTNQSAEIITFLHFFMELTMPGLCIRNETLIIVTTAINHEGDCKQIIFTVIASDGSLPVPLQDISNLCVCKGQTVSVRWSMHFTSIGKVTIKASAATKSISNSCDGANDDSIPSREDIVIKNITVLPEGINEEVTVSHLYIMKDSTVEKEVIIKEPSHLVKDSFEMKLVVVGDNIRLMVDNLVNLLNQPDGCCEQSLGRMAPVVFLLNYLNETGGLTAELHEKGKNLLLAAYARQLSCRAYNGQYSVFRGGSLVYNSWLDISVFFTLEKSKHYIFIDTNIQQQLLNQVGKTQDLKSGCFSPTGSLFTIPDANNTSMLYTAYVAKRLLQSDLYGIGGTMLQGALRCIQNADLDSMDSYTIANMFTVAALAKLEIWHRLSEIVKSRGIVEGGTIHWRYRRTSYENSYYFLPTLYPSSDVDITASIMLGFLYGPLLNQDIIDYVSLIATWLTYNQNSNGGFRSSQDTVGAVEAMTLYGKLVFSGKTNCEVVVHQGDKEVARVAVNEDNKIVVHKIPLPPVFGTYKITTTGRGSILTQLATKFNVLVTKEESPFTISVTTRTESCIEGVAPVIYTDCCASYHGSQSKTNMVLIDITGLTGYSFDRGSVSRKFPEDTKSYVENKDNHLHVYILSMVAGLEYCFSIRSFVENHALLYQSSPATIRDYYNAVDSAYTSYSYPCSSFAL